MFRSFLLLLLFTLSTLPSNTQAGVLIEPYVGYALGGDCDQTLGTNSFTQEYSAPIFGARLGYQTFGLMLGLDSVSYTHLTLPTKA